MIDSVALNSFFEGKNLAAIDYQADFLIEAMMGFHALFWMVNEYIDVETPTRSLHAQITGSPTVEACTTISTCGPI